MLSIGKMVAGAEDYYLRTVAAGREEYYMGSGEAPGEWLGKGAALLGLEGQVAPADLSFVLAGVTPDGTALGTRHVDPARRVAGFDLTWSAPKSVSLLYGLCDQATSDAVRRAHTESVADALGYLERHGLRVRRGAGGTQRLTADGLVAAAFVHRTSRAADPQLHTHVVVANVARGEDGAWSALDARRLYFHARPAGFLYQAALRARLTDELGVRFGPVVNGTAELADMDRGLLRAFSTRRQEILEYLEAVGGRSAKAAEVAALATRSPKAPDLVPPGADAPEGPGGLRARWQERAQALGVSEPELAELLGRHEREPLKENETRAVVEALGGPEGLTATESTFERRDVVRAVAAALVDGGSVAEVEAVADRLLESHDVLELRTEGRGGERRHTTTELLAVERRTLAGALGRRDAGVGVAKPDDLERVLARAAHLSEEQRAMVRRLVTSGSGVDVVVGKAGAGKTAALAVAREAWESAGHRVLGAALAARAAKGLADGAGIEATTVDRLLRRIERGEVVLGRRDVVVLDEAGMVGTRTLAAVLDRATQAVTKVVLVGDPRQLPEIEAGGLFGALAERLGAVELAENRRQHEVWERGALDELRAGHPALALAAYAGAGRVHVAEDLAAARGVVVERWLAAQRQGGEVLMLAVNRSDVAALNAAARAALRAAGTLGDDVATFGELSVAVGDTVVCLRNDASLGVVNGTRGTIVSADDDGLVLSTPDGRRSLPADYVLGANLDHGYAITVHKAQGATVDRAVVLATASLTREAGYVAMSRARKGTELVVPSAVIEDGVGCEPHGRAGPVEALERVGERLAVSKAKQLALFDAQDAGTGRPREARRPAGAGPVGSPAQRRTDPPPDTSAAHLQMDGRLRYRDAAMGRPPAFADERAEYDRVAELLDAYRARFGIDGDDPLGPRPLEARQRRLYDDALRDLRTYERRLGRSRELDLPDLGLGR